MRSRSCSAEQDLRLFRATSGVSDDDVGREVHRGERQRGVRLVIAGGVKAIVQRHYGGPETLELAEVPVPSIGADEVLVRIHAASVGAWVWHMMRPDPVVIRAVTGLRSPKQATPGEDMAGVVEAVGDGVTAFAPGDEVYGEAEGAFAEYVTTTPDKIARKPAVLSFVDAAAVPIAGATALIGLRDEGELRSGQRVLIIGGVGGVGSFAVQIARAMGADVTAVCSTDAIELAHELGAAHVVDRTVEPLVAWPTGFDLVLQLAGRDGATRLRRLLAPRGTLVLTSGDGGRLVGPIGRLVLASVLSPFVRQRFRTFVAHVDTGLLDELSRMIESGDARPVVERVFPLHEAADAVRHVEAGHARGKTVISMIES